MIDDFPSALQQLMERAAQLEVNKTGGVGRPESYGLDPAAWKQFEHLSQLSPVQVPPVLKRAREMIEKAGSLLDPESRLGERMRALLVKRLAINPLPFNTGERPALYEPAADGEWTFHGKLYTWEEQCRWLECELHRSAHDPVYFFTHYVFTQNTLKEGGSQVELIPDWPHVRAICDAMYPPRDVLIEKSRDMLVSWVAMAMVLHDLLFRWNWPIMTLSAGEALVDDGGERSTVDSLHGKVRFMYTHLPRAFQEGAVLSFGQKPPSIRHFAVQAHVKGFAATTDPGRGPKWKRAVCDEFAKVPWSEQVMMAITAACPRGKALISTPRGKANAFARIRYLASRQVFPVPAAPDPKEADRHWERYRIHWSLHPHRDDAWFEQKRAEASMTEEQISQEWQINFARSLGRRVYPAYQEEIHVAGGELASESACEYRTGRPLYLTCDFNHDPLIWEVIQTAEGLPRFFVISEICCRNSILDDAVLQFVFRYAARTRVEALERENPAWRDTYGRVGRLLAGDVGHFLPVVLTGDSTENKSQVYNRVKAYAHIKDLLVKFGGFDVRIRVPESNPPRHQRFDTFNDVLRKRAIVMAPQCEQLRKDCEGGVWNGQATDMDQRKDDDDSGLSRSHASSACGYLLCQLHKLGGSMTPIVQTRQRPSLKDLIPQLARW